mmetsp:Transcript_9324/g.28233  ORF Transcript_9324/g.28233 Transcript_9324/m.28233 type:complete len:663 (-) Transcript_9324:474-2462(-)
MPPAARRRDESGSGYGYACAVAIRCAEPEPDQPRLIHASEGDGRVRISRAEETIFSSTFDVVLNEASGPEKAYDAVSAAVQQASDGRVGCVVCCGTLESGKAAVMNGVPSWSLNGELSGPNVSQRVEDLASLAISPRALCEMTRKCTAQGATLQLSAVQFYFEQPFDLLPSSSNGGQSADVVDASATSLDGATPVQVKGEVHAVCLLAQAQRGRVQVAEPGTAHVVVQLSSSTGGRLVLIELARMDAISVLDHSTSANASLHASLKLLIKPIAETSADVHLLLPKLLRGIMRDKQGSRLALLCCVGHGSPTAEAATLRFAQQVKSSKRIKSTEPDAAKMVETLQALVEQEQGLALDEPAIEAKIREALGDEESLKAEILSMHETREGLLLQLAALERTNIAGESAEDAAEMRDHAEIVALNAELEKTKNEVAELQRELRAKKSSGPSIPTISRKHGATSEAELQRQLEEYDKAVNSAWEAMQRAQDELEVIEKRCERSQAHAERKAIEHEELESTLLDIATDLEDLARKYRQGGEAELAVPLYTSALKIIEKSLGEDHPQVASNLVNLGNAYCDQQLHAEAVPVYLRAMQIDQEALGEDHPEVAMDMSNLAIAYRALGRGDIARPLFERAHGIMLHALGPDHPKTQAVHRNLNQDGLAVLES